MSQQPLNQLRTWIAAQGLDAFLVTQPQNRSYLSGWLNDDVEGAGMLLIGQRQQVLLTNSLYKEIAEKEAEDSQRKSKKGKQVPEDQTETTEGGNDDDDDDYDNVVSFVGIFLQKHFTN